MSGKKETAIPPVFVMNNCKIANELRKYRDLTGHVNRVFLSSPGARGENRGRYADYVLGGQVSFFDTVLLNAACTLLYAGGRTSFRTETVAQVMAGDPSRRLSKEKRAQLSDDLERLSHIRLAILGEPCGAGRDCYEGTLLPLEREGELFRLREGETAPLYQYALDRSQLITVPAALLRDDPKKGQTVHSNHDLTLMLRHFLLQELEILFHAGNRVAARNIRVVRKDGDHKESGLLWCLTGDEGDDTGGKALSPKGQKLLRTLCSLLDNWKAVGYLNAYSLLADGTGVRVALEDNPPEQRRKVFTSEFSPATPSGQPLPEAPQPEESGPEASETDLFEDEDPWDSDMPFG